MNRPFEEFLTATVAAPNGDADTEKIQGVGFMTYIEVAHPGAGDPDYTLQVVNHRGIVIWETSEPITGDSIVHIKDRIPTLYHKIRIKGSTLAGLFNIFVHYSN